VFTSAKRLFGLTATVFVFTACSGGIGSSVAPSGGSIGTEPAQLNTGDDHTPDIRALITPPNVRPRQHKVAHVNVIRPNCCALTKTLFVTDPGALAEPPTTGYTGEVYAFDYLSGTLLGTLPAPPEGWHVPQGACGDKNGNVYFSNTEASTIDEYSHSGAFIQTLSDPDQRPIGCAFDRKTGNLAVASIFAAGDRGPGSVAIYHDGELLNTYFPPNIATLYFLGYEGGTGTLWLDGTDSSGIFHYDSFKNGKFKNVVINGATIGFPGTVAWSANTKTMNLGDQDTFSAPTIYQVSDSGQITGATVTQCTQESDFCDIVQATLKGPGLVGPDAVLVSTNRFAYPVGGAPTMNYGAPYVQPIGSVISPDKGARSGSRDSY
jgi:hypothetical protein